MINMPLRGIQTKSTKKTISRKLIGYWKHVRDISIWLLAAVDTTKVEGKVVKERLSRMT